MTKTIDRIVVQNCPKNIEMFLKIYITQLLTFEPLFDLYYSS